MTRQPRWQRGWRAWLGLHLGLGLAWCALIASRASEESALGSSPEQVWQILLFAAWLPSLALACWQVQRRRLRTLMLSDLLATGVLVLMACTIYQPLFFFQALWLLPAALLPRGVICELLFRLSRRLQSREN